MTTTTITSQLVSRRDHVPVRSSSSGLAVELEDREGDRRADHDGDRVSDSDDDRGVAHSGGS